MAPCSCPYPTRRLYEAEELGPAARLSAQVVQVAAFGQAEWPPTRAEGLLEALGCVARACPLLFPAHPRTQAHLAARDVPDGLRIVQPLGYLDFIALEASARLVLTDSGGVQEETTVLGVPCLTLRDTTERPLTVTEGTNVVVGRDPTAVAETARRVIDEGVPARRPTLWDGHAAERIGDVLVGSS
jgi:UDP-N-acetylglucosamine 2-epimerase (non-hydrolysing)